MKDWKEILVDSQTSFLNAIELLDKVGLHAVLVVHPDRRLLGIITDGDVRRAILKNVNLNTPVLQIMNTKVTVATVEDDREQMLAKLHSLSLYHLPIVDNQNRVVGLETIDSLLSIKRRDNIVVIMAGGIGKRLRPLTFDCPKPMIKVGDKPVLERLIENFIKYGFYNIYFAVHYKAEMIKQYFADGSKWGVNIQYLEEETPLGTAGALSLLKQTPNAPFFVMNADVMTSIDFRCLLQYHKECPVNATICIREHEQKIPYGVVQRDNENNFLINIVEKPLNYFFVNTGIYILEPSLLQLIPNNQYYDMPELLMEAIRNNHKIATFPVKEYWLDIGQHEDLEKAHNDYEGIV